MSRPGKARAEPRQEADGLSYGSVDFPCQLHFPILHPSTAHVSRRARPVLKVGRSD